MSKKWKYVTTRDRAVSTTGAVTGAAVLGAGLSLFFNPVAVGVAAGLGVLTAAGTTRKAFRKSIVNRLISSGQLIPVDSNAPINQMVSEINEQLGRKESAPNVYILKGKNKFDKKSAEDTGLFAAVPGANIIMTTEAALNNYYTNDELRFIAAHEMSHLKANDNRNLSITAQIAAKQTIKYLMLGCVVSGVAAIFGASIPVIAAGSFATFVGTGAAAIGANVVSKYAMKFGQRGAEQRADRNALYVTRDFENGKSALEKACNGQGTPASLQKVLNKPPLLIEGLLTHPSFDRRIKIMSKAFKKVMAAPALAAPVAQQSADTADQTQTQQNQSTATNQQAKADKAAPASTNQNLTYF